MRWRSGSVALLTLAHFSVSVRAHEIVEALEVGLERQAALLAVFLGDRPHEVAHPDIGVLVGSAEGGGERAVADRPARELELRREETEVDVIGNRRLAREDALPDPAAVVGLGERE